MSTHACRQGPEIRISMGRKSRCPGQGIREPGLLGESATSLTTAHTAHPCLDEYCSDLMKLELCLGASALQTGLSASLPQLVPTD